MAVGCSVALYALALLPRTLVLILTVNAVSRWTSPARNELMRSTQPRSQQSLLSDDSNRSRALWRQHDLVREVDGRVVHRWQHDLLGTSSQLLTLVMVTIPICIIVRGHARSHGTRRKVGRAWLCWPTQKTISGGLVGWCNNKTRDGFDGEVN
jgi:hypothetical protein